MNSDNPEVNLTDPPQETKASPVENVTGIDLAAQVTSLTAERDQLAAEKAEIQDRLLRMQAEFDNYRKRNERDRSDFIQYAGMDVVKEILPLLDDFERAAKTEGAQSDLVREYAKGIELIYQRLFDTLKKIGLEPIDTSGETFDPHLHQAIERVATDEGEDHAIVGEFQRGYLFKGKLLRPSMVKVAVR